jgi:hypothetical protein
MELARDLAIMAQENKTHENRVNAKDMKIAANKRLDQRGKDLHELYEKRVAIVEQVHS